MKSKSNKHKTEGVKNLHHEIENLFKQNPDKSLAYSTIAKRLAIRKSNRVDVQSSIMLILDSMLYDETIKEVSTGIFKYNQKAEEAQQGSIEVMPSGNGFVTIAGYEQDIFIAANKIFSAINGDTVKIIIYPKRGKGRLEGEVIEIVKRNKETFVGIIEVMKHIAIIKIEKAGLEIQVPISKINGAKNGQKVLVKVTEFPTHHKFLIGEVKTVLGNPGENETEMHAILAEYDLPYHFTEEVEKEADNIPEEITKEEIAKRRDFRKTTTFTIDPFDAKDFDDALSFEKLENGHVEIGIHIADVSHYIQPGSILDDEAFARATSVYLVDRVVPMLPEKLSNKVCSLRPNEEKLCFSASFEMDEEGNIYNEWFGKSIINSQRRFTYEEAQQVLETGQGDLSEELLLMDKIAKNMRKKRYKKGSISFDTREVKFNIDKDGKPTGVYFKIAKDSNNLIEDFMLLANRKVAELMSAVVEQKKDEKLSAFVYRVHDSPNEEKLLNFSKFAKKFGYKLKTTGQLAIAKSMNELLDEIKGKKEQNLMQTLAIRSMAKAIYTTKNIGHYGLAFEHYTHFTSPIRRYPDVLVHRILNEYLSDENKKSKLLEKVINKSNKRGVNYNMPTLEPMCKHCSDREKLAADAERSSIKYKQVEFMQDKLGNIYKAVISGVTDFGIFAEIEENLCEGFIRLNSIKTDYFEFDQENYCITGRRTKKVFRLGDEIYVKVAKANLVKKQLDFELESSEF
jgi:ribonuclease R